MLMIGPMDVRSTIGQIVLDSLSNCESRGPTSAQRLLVGRIPLEEIESSEGLRTLVAAYKSASAAEKRKMRRAVEDLAGFGVHLPRDLLFYLGVPRKEFGLRVDLLDGRLGDTLEQLAKFVHAMHALNLVLFVNSRLSSHRSVMLSCADSFGEEFSVYDGNEGALRDYVLEVSDNCAFSLSLIRELSPSLFSKLPSNEVASLGAESLVIHVRGGDALFLGALALPPLTYYKSAILSSGLKRVVVVSEPGNPLDPCVNPVPELIQDWCDSSAIDCVIQSSDELEIDAATLFYAKNVVASNSSFSKWLPLYGESCESLVIPGLPGGGDRWVQDECVTYIDCWGGFDSEKWSENLNYRLAWVSGGLQSN